MQKMLKIKILSLSKDQQTDTQMKWDILIHI